VDVSVFFYSDAVPASVRHAHPRSPNNFSGRRNCSIPSLSMLNCGVMCAIRHAINGILCGKPGPWFVGSRALRLPQGRCQAGAIPSLSVWLIYRCFRVGVSTQAEVPTMNFLYRENLGIGTWQR